MFIVIGGCRTELLLKIIKLIFMEFDTSICQSIHVFQFDNLIMNVIVCRNTTLRRSDIAFESKHLEFGT